MLPYIYFGNLCNWEKYNKNNKKYDAYIPKFDCESIYQVTLKSKFHNYIDNVSQQYDIFRIRFIIAFKCSEIMKV